MRARAEPQKNGLPGTESAVNNRFPIPENWSENKWLLISVGSGKIADEEMGSSMNWLCDGKQTKTSEYFIGNFFF